MSKFSATPGDINSFARKSSSFLESTIIPHLEYEAIAILIKAGICDEDYYNPTGPHDGEAWRLFWLNEALHQCENFNPAGDAGKHLEPAERAAVNVLVSASALRDALDQGNAEEAAALAMILVSDAVIGGLSIELKELTEKHNSSKRIPYETGIGKKKADFDRMKEAVIDFARTAWKDDPSVLIGNMASNSLDHVSINFSEYKTLKELPEEKTVLGWLRNAGKRGDLEIPKQAQKGGRPRKTTE